MASEEKGSGNKPRRIFLIGTLSGVVITAAVTFVFAIPANTYHWQMEIWKRGGGAWCFDKNGNISWMWTVKPVPDAPPKKRATVPAREGNVILERL
jgi:hypothetical protein